MVCLGLRIWLALGGGQAFWPDEARYGVARNAAYEVAHRHWRPALEMLLGGADHVLFRWVGLPAALAEYYIGSYHPALAACYFGLFSVGAIWMVWAVARRAGASEPEAMWAAVFAAASNSLFFYTRHYLPYDVSLFAMLGGLWLAIGPWSPRRSFLAGTCVSLGFLTYNGYWLLGACVLTLHAVLGDGGRRRLVARSSLAFLGLILPIGLFVAMGVLVAGNTLLSYRTFAQTVKQGDFHIGYRVIVEYLWSAENLLLVVLLAAFLYGLSASSTGEGARARMRWWAASVVFVYLGLVIFSDAVPVFMVYGRLSRAIVPFLCLGAGAGVARFLASRGASRRAWARVLVVLVACLAARNFAAPLSQVFPDRFLKIFAHKASEIPQGEYNFYRVLFTGSLWGRSLENADKEPGLKELLRLRNPLQYKPYQFEGYSDKQRSALNSADVAMRVLEVPERIDSPGRWDDYPGPVRMTLRFPSNRQHMAEPLVCTGRTGQGDVVFVRYVDATHVQFGHDHWGLPAEVSKTIETDYERPHELLICAGSLFPPPESGVYRRDPGLAVIGGQLVVLMDGLVVLSKSADFFPAPQRSIGFGVNLIGGSAAEPSFNGDVTDFRQAALEDFAPSNASIAAAEIVKNRGPEWAGAVGPVRMRFIMPAASPGPQEGQPLLSLMGPSDRQVLFVVRQGNKVRIGLDIIGRAAVWSPPLDGSPSGVDEAGISIGPLLPGAEAPVYGPAPGFVAMRNMAYVTFNNSLALFAETPLEGGGPCAAIFGMNIPGSTASAPYFKGELTSIEAIGLRDVIAGKAAGADSMLNAERVGWKGYTGPLELKVRFSEGHPGDTQPLLTTGVAGKGDIVFVKYAEDGNARICVDHWTAPLLESAPFALSPGTLHVLTLGLGSLYPPEGSLSAAEEGGLGAARDRMHIAIDGRTVLDRVQATYPSPPERLAIGANLIGGSSVGAAFYGKIEGISRVPLGAVPR